MYRNDPIRRRKAAIGTSGLAREIFRAPSRRGSPSGPRPVTPTAEVCSIEQTDEAFFELESLLGGETGPG